MTDQTKTRFPAPLYAAAGAGDLAYQQLRKLPAVINELSDRAAASLRNANETATNRATLLRDRANSADFDQFRSTAASSTVALAHAAQDRAIAIYTALVARGERVVGTGVVEAADVVNADLETTEQPKAVESAEAVVSDTATEPDAVSEPKARKRTRPAAE
jgi:heparin binding hemagglutinin HbhA